MADDKQISNTSYTSKDFQSIYPELIDLVKKLSTKWDPSLSNESDPGVLLLKLNALVADKNNYNIDKNVLECFPTSVTQVGNARRLYDSLGYKMHHYKSANATIAFQLKSATNINQYLTIEQFTGVTDSTGQIVYTTTRAVNLSTLAKAMLQQHEVPAIEGKVVDFTINGNANIKLDSLDTNNRLYFNEYNVAENGIFIKRGRDTNWDSWSRVDNLTSEINGQYVYEFGVLPNSDTCYIQFPEDVSSLLDDSAVLNIKYTLSTGESGNIKANTLTQFEKALMTKNIDDEDVEVTNQVRIIQAKGTIDGVDPETLNAAYRNYKKTIGTFNTLITRRDYENFAYNATVDSKNLISNCVVADRTCDLNASTKVKVWTPNYSLEKTIIKCKVKELDDDQYEVTNEPLLNAYNIVLYALNPGDGTYDSTFIPNEDGLIQAVLEAKVKDAKAIEHDFLSPIGFENVKDAIYYLYKNLYALNGKIVTYSKVTKEEAAEIEQKVIDALSVNYNARYVEFGKEPDYLELIDTIQNADSRIKTVALDIPKFQVYHVARAGVGGITDNELDSNYYFNTPGEMEKFNIVAKMILAGKTQLLKFDDSFNYDFGYKNITKPCNDNYIESITTEANIELTPYEYQDLDNKGSTENGEIKVPTYNNPSQIDKSYTLKANETIQLFAPNYVTITEYSTNVKYYLYVNATERPNEEFKDAYIEADTDYVIKSGECLKLQYTDENGIVRTESLTQGTVINCTKDIPLTAQSYVTSQFYEIKKSNILTTTTKDSEANDPTNYASYWRPEYLYSGQSLSVKKINRDTLNKSTKIYFITHNVETKDDGKKYCTLKIDSDNPRILLEDEYLLYTNSNTDELFLLGSGTMLSADGQLELSCPSVDVTDLTSSDHDGINWIELTADLTITELNITTIGKDATIELVDSETNKNKVVWVELDETNFKPVVLNNTTRKLLNADGSIIAAKITDKSGKIVILNNWIDEYGVDQPYWIHSRLSLNVMPNSAQYINNGQKVILNYIDSQGSNVSVQVEDKYITFSDSIILSGGTEIDAAVLDSSGNYNYTLQAYTYDKFDNSSFKRDGGIITLNGKPDLGQSYKQWSLPFDFSIVNENTKLDTKENNYVPSGWLLQLYNSKVTMGSKVELFTSKLTLNDLFTKYYDKTDEDAIYYTSNNLKDILTISNSTEANYSVILKSNSSLYSDLIDDTNIVKYKYLVNESTLEICELGSWGYTSDTGAYIEIKPIIKDGSLKNLDKYIASPKDSDLIPLQTYTDYLKNGLKDESTQYNKSVLDTSGSYIMYVPIDSDSDVSHNIFVRFTGADEFDTVSIGKINRFNGFNIDEINVEANPDENNYSSADNFNIIARDTNTKNYIIFDVIESIISGSDQPGIQFDWTYRVKESEKVLYPTLSSSYWNTNHVLNMYTIPQIDLSLNKDKTCKTQIKVNSYSIKS